MINIGLVSETGCECGGAVLEPTVVEKVVLLRYERTNCPCRGVIPRATMEFTTPEEARSYAHERMVMEIRKERDVYHFFRVYGPGLPEKGEFIPVPKMSEV
jgi:hypothetical protein